MRRAVFGQNSLNIEEAEYLCLLCLEVSHQLTSFSVPNNDDYTTLSL